MSQQIRIKTMFKNINHLEQAVKQLGWTWNVGGHVVYYSGRGEECEYTVDFKHTDERLSHSRYNLGFQHADDETWTLLCDNAMAGPVTNRDTLGGETPRIRDMLTRSYSEVCMLDIARNENHRAEVLERRENGRVHMRIYGDF